MALRGSLRLDELGQIEPVPSALCRGGIAEAVELEIDVEIPAQPRRAVSWSLTPSGLH
jgi:hypothetical protein